MALKKEFYRDLTNWYSENKRDFPWRKTKNPYNIWICEIIFQQTRISQGLHYYENFIDNFPTLNTLAEADEKKVLKLWEGLGYYSRARNLHFTAKHVENNLDSHFPTTYKDLLKLKGIGPYTAAAIASICFEEKVPALDGNALRVYSRIFNSFLNIAETSTSKYYFELLKDKLPQNSGDFNQAIMELGALICTPTKPECTVCPVQKHCLSFKKQTQTELPIKIKKKKITEEKLCYNLYYNEKGLFVQQRNMPGIWRNLYELSPETHFKPKKNSTIKHLLTHKKLEVHFFDYKISDKEKEILQNKTELNWVSWSELRHLAMPIPIKNFMHNFAEIYIFEKT